MKSISGLVLLFLFTAFMPAGHNHTGSHAPYFYQFQKQVIKPAVSNYVLQSADTCRSVALVNQKYWPDPAIATVMFCDNTVQTITLLPGEYIELQCVSTSYGVVISQGQLTVDWMGFCL